MEKVAQKIISILTFGKLLDSGYLDIIYLEYLEQ